MIRREGKGPPPRDLLVCFPTRAHLTLMPKAVSSPRRHLHHHNHHLRRSMRGGSTGGGHGSPHLWSGTKKMSSDNLSEPTSPKVTCAGQIKVRPRAGACKNWQTVMKEIERLHNNRKKKPTWVEALGFKKEVMHFLACLRSIKFDFRCFGAFSHVDVTSDDEDEDEDDNVHDNDKIINQDHHDYDHDHDHDTNDELEVSSQTVFSKWFMVLQENQDCGVMFSKDEKSLKPKETDQDLPCLPPANALLLMRCRSAPAKSWMEEKQEDDDDDDDDDDNDGHDDKEEEEEEHAGNDDGDNMKKKESKRKSLMELMKTESDSYELSSDIGKETWIKGGIHKDPFSRSRSWKR